MEPRLDSPKRRREFHSCSQEDLLYLTAISPPGRGLAVPQACPFPHTCGGIWVCSPALHLAIAHSTEKMFFNCCTATVGSSFQQQVPHSSATKHKVPLASIRDCGHSPGQGPGENSSPRFVSSAFIADFCQPSPPSKMKQVLFCDRKSVARE